MIYVLGSYGYLQYILFIYVHVNVYKEKDIIIGNIGIKQIDNKMIFVLFVMFILNIFTNSRCIFKYVRPKFNW